MRTSNVTTEQVQVLEKKTTTENEISKRHIERKRKNI